MKKIFSGVVAFMFLMLGCSQGTINDLPFIVILLPALVAIIVVVFVILKSQQGFYISPKNVVRKNLESEISRAKRYNHKTGLLIFDVKSTVPRGVHYFLPGRTIDVESIQSKLRGHDQVIKLSLRRYKVILPQIADDDNTEEIKERLLQVAKEKEWGEIRIGVSSYPKDGETANELIKAAESDLKE